MSNPTFDIQPDGRSDRNLALSTVKTYAAVISACHESYGERSVFVNPRVKCFLKGNRKTATCHAPLGITVGINSVSTCSRESSFQVFNTNPSQIAAFQNIYSLNHNFGKESEWLVYALHLYIPHRNDMENASHHGAHLIMWHARQASDRHCSIESVHREILWQNRGSVVVWSHPTRIYQSREDPLTGVRAHCTRALSSATALLRGMTVEDICMAASWASQCP